MYTPGQDRKMLPIQDQSLRPIITAHLAQTMSLLVLSNAELREKVAEELDQNPALELVEDRTCPSCKRPILGDGPCPYCSLNSQDAETIVFLSARESRSPPPRLSDEDELHPVEPAAPENLVAYVLEQLALELSQEERKLAEYILSSLDDDGFLSDPPAIIARATRAPLDQVHRVLALIANADPPGLATAGPREALIAQLKGLADRFPTAVVAIEVLQNSFHEVGNRNYEAVAKLNGISLSEARRAGQFIQDRLNPFPARAYWGSGRHPAEADPNVYYSPDVEITRASQEGQDRLMVEIFSPYTGRLRVNPILRRLIRESSDEPSWEWSQHLERAALFVKCMQQRGNTMQRLMSALATLQRSFILSGNRHLKPITQAKLARQLGVHESTVSRAVSGKSVALPDGRIIPLKQFFDRSLPIRDRIREIIENETQPLTDAKISQILRQEGICVARRTVAKYRSMERILPARLRGNGKAARKG